MVVIHALNQHYSAPNLSSTSRCAYILHAIDGPADTWAAENWSALPSRMQANTSHFRAGEVEKLLLWAPSQAAMSMHSESHDKIVKCCQILLVLVVT